MFIKYLINIIIPLLFLILFILIFNITYFSSYNNYGKLITNEVMSKNTYTLMDNNGDYFDKIELYNNRNEDIYLSDMRILIVR